MRERAAWIAAAFIAMAIPALFVTTKKTGEWNDCYYAAAGWMCNGESIAARSWYYTYPPAMAMFTIPLATESLPLSKFLWSLVNVAALATLFVSCWKLAGGANLTKLASPWSIVFALTLLICGRWIVSPLEHLQYDAVIAALLAAGCLQVARGRDILGGVLVGLSASMKLTPLLFLPYFVWRGRFRTALCTAIVAVGTNFLPDLFFPQTSGASYMVEWYEKFLATTLGGTSGAWHTAVHLNQSLAGFFNRMAGIWTTDSMENLTIVVFDDATRELVKRLTQGTSLLLLGITLCIGRRPFRGPCETGNSRDNESINLFWSLEFGMLMALMILISPMSSKAHYVTLILPSLLAVRFVVERPTAWRRTVFVLLLATGLLGSKEILGSQLGDAALIWGVTTIYPLVLLAAMWELHSSLRRAASAKQQAREVFEVPVVRCAA
ncbi:MAG: glycosyltransferase family 87 protein [Pirellulales bacterium]